MNVKVKGVTAGFLKTALLLIAALAGLLIFGAGTARAEEGPVYGLYRQADEYSSEVYACDDKGKLIDPVSIINKHDVTNLFVEEGMQWISDSAFEFTKNLKEVTLASTVKEIGPEAFLGSGLETINLPGGLEKIENDAFLQCANLTTITLPKELTDIGENAFEGSGLKTITVPEKVTVINEGTFLNCASLKTVTLKGITDIGASAFSRSGLETINLSEGLTKIGDYAFGSCQELTTITLPTELTDIGPSAFAGSGLKTITVPEKVTVINEGTFRACASLKAVTLPGEITDIGKDAFKESGLKTINLPESLKKIGEYAFEFCQDLTTIKLPTELTDIDDGAFAYTGLESITVPESVTEIKESTFQECAALKTATLPKGLTNMGYGAFMRTGLKTINLPDGLKTIGKNAFLECQDLTTIKLPTELTDMGDGAFQLSGLETITVPEKVTVINEWTFGGCAALKTINLPENLKKIGTGAFFICSDLTTITLPTEITDIGPYAFSGSGLETITVPDSVAIIDQYTFADCAALKTATLPSKLTKIDDLAFSNCSSLSRVVLSGATPPAVGTDAFQQVPTLRYAELVGDAASDEVADSYINWCTTNGFTKILDLAKDVDIPSPEDQTYTGHAFEPTINIPGTEGTDYRITYENNTNAGKATVNITSEGCYGMYSGSTSKTFMIKKATPAYEVPQGLTATYGQTLADVTLPAGFSWKEVPDTPVGNVGSHVFKVTYTPEDVANYNTVTNIDVTLTVSRGESALTIQADKPQYTYGDAITLTVDIGLKTQSRSLFRAAADTLDFYLGDPTNGQQLAAAPVENGKATATINKNNPHYPNAGSADITVVYHGSDSLNESRASISIDMAPAEGTAQVTLAGWTYGQPENSPVPSSATNGTANVTYAYKAKDAADATYQSAVPTAAGQYTVRATFGAFGNYAAVTATADFTIEKAKPVMTITPEAGKEIQVGKPITLNIAVKGVKDENPEGTVDILGNTLPLEDGQASIDYILADAKPITLTATYTPAEGENYTSAQAKISLEAGKINREPIVVSDMVKTYGDAAFTLTPAGGSLQAGEAYTYKSDNRAVATVKADGIVTITGAGTAHITVSVPGSSVWNPAEAVMTLTVNKAKITGVTFEDATFTEDGKEHKIELTGQLPKGTAVTYENNVQTAPGVYTAQARIDGGANYESLELSATLTITAKPVDPDQPDTPDKPDTPDTPGTPDKPGTPGEGGQPGPAPEAGDTPTHAESALVRSANSGSGGNIRTGLTQTSSTSGAAVLLSLAALTGICAWKKKRKN